MSSLIPLMECVIFSWGDTDGAPLLVPFCSFRRSRWEDSLLVTRFGSRKMLCRMRMLCGTRMLVQVEELLKQRLSSSL